MSKWDDSPSFSSTILDKIYRSIDDCSGGENDVKFYGETRKKTTERKMRNARNNASAEKEEMAAAALRRACLIEKWVEMKAKEKAEAERRRMSRDHDDSSVIFSSNSCSSESSSGGLSSSDYESIYGARPPQKYTSSFVPSLWPKPIRTRPVKTEELKTGQKQSALFPKHKDSTFLDDYANTRSSNLSANVEELTIKNKSRALKVYDNLKKVKQPISPGGRVASFLNSLVKKKSKAKSSSASSQSCYETERRVYSLQGSACSSASSFSRSCLSKHSPSTREKLRNGIKKSVQFDGEYRQHCSQKCVYAEQYARFTRSQSRRADEDIVKLRALEKSQQAEQSAREYLKERRNQAKNESLFTRDFDNYDDMDDDAASCSSSELFELDHLAVAGKERYLEELPVYETTRVNRTNRPIF